MVSYADFSALRLSRIFPADLLDSYSFYVKFDGVSGFDSEYLGGQWSEESIDGARFWYPETAAAELGAVEVWGNLLVAGGCPVGDRPGEVDWRLAPLWAANADRVLETLGLPIRLGTGEAGVRALAAGRVMCFPFPDEWYVRVAKPADKGSLSTLTFACRMPDVFYMKAVIHVVEGLLKLDVFRPDLVKVNDHTGGYGISTHGMYDEGLR